MPAKGFGGAAKFSARFSPTALAKIQQIIVCPALGGEAGVEVLFVPPKQLSRCPACSFYVDGSTVDSKMYGFEASTI